MESPTGKIATRKPPACNMETVADLIKERKWNKALIEETFSKEEASQILAMPLKSANSEWLEGKEELTENNERHRTGTSHQLQNHQWRPPDAGVVKINTDAAIPTKLAGAGLGMIAKDDHGNLVEARGTRKYSRGGAEMEMADAIRQGLLMAKEVGWQRIEMQFDCKAAIEQIHKKGEEETPIDTIMEDIKQLSGMFQYCSFSFVYRDGNRCAYQLAQFATKLVSNIVWKQSFPLWLKESIQEDNRTNVHFCN
nr:uncharacterized protein LOC113736922 [Coffea arabica]